MSSIAITDGILFLSAAWLASRLTLPIGYRLALGLLGIAALQCSQPWGEDRAQQPDDDHYGQADR